MSARRLGVKLLWLKAFKLKPLTSPGFMAHVQVLLCVAALIFTQWSSTEITAQGKFDTSSDMSKDLVSFVVFLSFLFLVHCSYISYASLSRKGTPSILIKRLAHSPTTIL